MGLKSPLNGSRGFSGAKFGGKHYCKNSPLRLEGWMRGFPEQTGCVIDIHNSKDNPSHTPPRYPLGTPLVLEGNLAWQMS